MQMEESHDRELARIDYNLARLHGEMTQFEIIDIDQTTGRFKCVATFADDFQHASLRTRAQVANAQFVMQTREKRQQNQDALLKRHSALPRPENDKKVTQPFEVDRSHVTRTSGQALPSHLVTPNLNRMSLKDYARSSPDRNRLLNGKLFTRQLLGSIDHAAIPDAMK